MRQSWTDDKLDDLRMEMRAGFVRLESLIQQHTQQVEKQIEQMDKRIDQRLKEVDQRLERVETRVETIDDRLTTRIEAVNERLEFGFGRLDGRIDSLARASVYLAAVLSTTVVALFASRLFA